MHPLAAPILLAAGILLSAFSLTALQPELTRHADVIDAGTLNLNLPGYTALRLEGLDAPQAEYVCTRNGQPWNCGADARAYLIQLLEQQDPSMERVSCKPIGKDAEQRTVARCWTYSSIDPQHHGINISERMLDTGLAFPMIPTPPALQLAVGRAKHSRAGLWGTDNSASGLPHAAVPAASTSTH